MAVTPLPVLDRTAATFKTDTDTFFGSQLPTFSVQVNQVATDAQASANSANTSKNAAATSATNAATSATNAANSATAANTSKTNAATSETNAAASATAANASKTAAAASQTAAAGSASTALTQANRAQAAADSIASGPVTSVNGKTGAPVLNKSDIGLALVDNVSVKAAGIGVTPLLNAMANIDEAINISNGWYSVSPSTTGTIPIGATRGTVLVSGRAFQADARISQLFFQEDANKVHTRVNTGASWSTWLELTLPSVASLSRKPLTTGEASSTSREWSDTLSIPKYIDKIISRDWGGSVILNCSDATVFDISLTANVTMSVSNLPTLSGESLTLVIRVRQNAAPKTITWFSGITWVTPGGLAPATPSANQIVEYILSSTGTGTTWVGRVGAST